MAGIWWCPKCAAQVPVHELNDGSGNRHRWHSVSGCFDWVYLVPEGVPNFWAMTPAERLQAFEALVVSAKTLGYYGGWDYLDGETLLDWYKAMHWRKKRDALVAVRERHGVDGRTMQSLWPENQAVKFDLWREAFKALPLAQQGAYLLDHLQEYEAGQEVLGRSAFDWSTFECAEASNTARVAAVQRGWQQLSFGIYRCKGCPCLRESSDSSTMYRCFKPYLESKKMHPDDNVPSELRTR
jgi:hypothetical protein